MKYRIDDLGWLSFERLIQSLLKAELGIGVEAWGGPSDHGRDAYCEADLAFPVQDAPSVGPTVFQAKFVKGANAAGARPFGPLRKAIDAEIKRVEQRIAQGRWANLRRYALLTNVPLTSGRREKLQALLEDAFPGVLVSTQGAEDICCMLDNAPAIRKSYPEILGLADLRALIREAVSPSIQERSASAILEAEELSRVFVATSAYYKALDHLSKYHFAVLDGAPEMGKTAIARMVALALHLDGWTAVECREPDDFYAAYESGNQQIFIADDALGRTEFDVGLGRQWERDLPRILRRTDASHWLVWTTRKHILLRALAQMDLIAPATGFPDPGEVVVDAGDLTMEEKARILYRHAKSSCVGAEMVSIVQDHAQRIVESKFFTPERIRRFVQETLPALAERDDVAVWGALDSAVDEAIQSPTTRMRLAFGALPLIHCSLLVDMLECGRACSRTDLLRIYRVRHGSITEAEMARAIEDLTGTFIKPPDRDRLDWIHPSYRDVVIDAVSDDADLQTEFVRHANLEGLQLAFSTEGGATGNRNLPFVRCQGSWDAAAHRLIVLARGRQLAQVLDLVGNALSGIREDDVLAAKLERLALSSLEAIAGTLSVGRTLSSHEILSLHRLHTLLGIAAPMIRLSDYLKTRLHEIADELREGWEFDSGMVQEVFSLVNWVNEFENQTLSDADVDRLLDFVLDAVYEYAENEADYYLPAHGDHDEDIEECDRLAAAFGTLTYGDLRKASEMARALEYQRDLYLESQIEVENEPLDYSWDSSSRRERFNISVFFADL